jgi:ribonuclease Z
MAVQAKEGFLLVDCGESPIPRLITAGLSPDRVEGLAVSHFHPDHVAGAPLLLVDLWLLGRKRPLPILGSRDVLDRLWTMMDLFRWDEWKGFYPLHQIELNEQPVTMERLGLRLTPAAVNHAIPTLAFRFEDLSTGGVAVFSADSAPCPALTALAQEADLLFHEAAGFHPSHSTPTDAGETAQKAGARQLILVHYPSAPELHPQWLEEAQAAFDGPVSLGQDFETFIF